MNPLASVHDLTEVTSDPNSDKDVTRELILNEPTKMIPKMKSRKKIVQSLLENRKTGISKTPKFENFFNPSETPLYVSPEVSNII